MPGIIFALAWMFTQALVVDKGMGATEAMSESRRLTKGRRGELFLYALLALCVNLLGVLACCVGLIVTSLITTLAGIDTYLRFSDQPVAPRP